MFAYAVNYAAHILIKLIIETKQQQFSFFTLSTVTIFLNVYVHLTNTKYFDEEPHNGIFIHEKSRKLGQIFPA